MTFNKNIKTIKIHPLPVKTSSAGTDNKASPLNEVSTTFQMNIKERLVFALKRSSVKVVAKLMSVDSVNLKKLWTVAVLLFLSLGFYQSYELIEKYLSYPYMTLIKEHKISPLDAYSFPDIQVCNINPSGLLRQAPTKGGLEEYLKLVENKTNCNNCSEDDQVILNQMSDDFKSIVGYITYLGENRTRHLLPSYRDFLVECLAFPVGSTSGVDCNGAGTVTIRPSLEHLLFLKWTIPPVTLIYRISMTFYIDSFETDHSEYNSKYFEAATSSGVKYTFCDTDTDCEITYTSGPVAPPGFLASVRIKKDLYTRLPEPHGKCNDDIINYTFGRCVDQTFLHEYFNVCNCTYGPGFALEEQDLPVCFTVDQPQSSLIENSKCIHGVTPIAAAKSSRCAEKCSEFKFSGDPSYTTWPLPYQYSSFYRQFVENKPYEQRFRQALNETGCSSQSKIKELIKENFVKIDFSLNTKTYLEFQEVPKYTVFSFVGTLGGALNLWTGITAVVVIEIIEAVVNICRIRDGN